MKKLLLLTLLLVGCQTVPTTPPGATPAPVATPSPPPATTPVATPTPAPATRPPLVALSWEKFPRSTPWSAYVFTMISDELLESFDSAADAPKFCTKYATLSKAQKATVWSELISAVASYESGWNPISRYIEANMGVDPVTGMQVASEGLLQLSYQDVPNYPSVPQCKEIDYKTDKQFTKVIIDTDGKKKTVLDYSNPHRTILDPYINLNCGIRIMAKLVNKYAIISNSKNQGPANYWSTLRGGSAPGHRLTQIQAMTQKLPFCN